jgi:2-dehydropantoate 2-reductase
MKSIKRVTLIGLGAIGASIGQKLHELDPQMLTVLADEDRIIRYKKDGIIVNDKRISFNYLPPDAQTEPADLLLVAVKHHHLPAALQDVRNHIGPHTTILSLMNGITSEEIIGAHYGMDKMLYGVCVGIDAVREGQQTRYSTMGRVFFGEKVNTHRTPRVLAVDELFEHAAIPFEIPDDMMRTLWWKFMANVGINQPSAILGATYQVFQHMEEAKRLMEQTLKEVIALANAVGVNLTADDLTDFHRIIATFAPGGKTSMLQDIEAGRKTEVEMLAGTVVSMGNDMGYPPL